MSQIKIAFLSLGYLPHFVNFVNVQKWKSKVFEVISYERIELLPNTDGWGWHYSDSSLEEIVPSTKDADFTLAIINAPLQGNFYVRRLHANRIVVTLFDMAEILQASDIPLDNFVLRTLYKYSIAFKKYQQIPVTTSVFLSHDETRGCLFDMTLIKTDIVYSMERLALCDECRTTLKQAKVPSSFLESAEKELKKIRKGTYYRILSFVKHRPILAILISLLTGILINVISSIIYELLLKQWLI